MVEGEYIVPYSSHSNYKEIEMFVNSLRPAILKCVVREHRSNYQKINNVKQFNSYMFTLQSLRQTGYELLLKKYTSIETLSKSYLEMMNPNVMDEISKRLGLKVSETQIFEEDSRRFDKSMAQVLKARNKNKLNKGVKLKKPEENEDLTLEDVEFLKNSTEQSESTCKNLDTTNDGEYSKGKTQNESKENFDDSFSFTKSMTKVKVNQSSFVLPSQKPAKELEEQEDRFTRSQPARKVFEKSSKLDENKDFEDEFK